MNRFLDKFNLPRLNQKEIEIMKRPITSTEIETVIKKSPKKQKSRARWLHRWIPWNIQRRADAFLLKLPKNCRERNTSKLILRGYHHSDTKTKQRQHKKRKLQANITDEHRCKNLNKILANRIQIHIKKLIHHEKLGFIPRMQGLFNICKSMWYTLLTNW